MYLCKGNKKYAKFVMKMWIRFFWLRLLKISFSEQRSLLRGVTASEAV
jgi:hypothetical protein